MKSNQNIRCATFIAGIVFVASIGCVLGGHPTWPPRKHSAEYRQANALFLRFQDALAAERWADALALCSERVHARAAGWPSPKAFFHDTIPIELLLARDFGYWTLRSSQPMMDASAPADSANFYGLFVDLTPPDAQPVLQWYWAIMAANNSWVVDYPPVKLDDYMARKKAALKERENRAKEIRLALAPRLKDCTTRLVPVTGKFKLGSPMLFRVELSNHGPVSLEYMDSGVAYASLTVLDEQGQALSWTNSPAQIMVRHGRVAAGATVVLADRLDLNQHCRITRPGTYQVQFSGAELQFGQYVPGRSTGLFGEDEPQSDGSTDFFGLPNRIPSDFVSIKVTGGD